MGNNNSIINNKTETDSETSNFHTINSDIFLSSLGHQSNYHNNSSINDKNINQKIIRLNNILGGNFNKITETSESVLEQVFKQSNNTNNKNNNYDTITTLNMNSLSDLSNTSPFINNEIVRNMVQKGGKRSDSSSENLSLTSSENLSISNSSSLSNDDSEVPDYMSSTAHYGGATSESISYNSNPSDKNSEQNKDFIYPSDDESSISSPYRSEIYSNTEMSGGYTQTSNKEDSDNDDEQSEHYRLQYSDSSVNSDMIKTENINIIAYD